MLSFIDPFIDRLIHLPVNEPWNKVVLQVDIEV